MVILLCECEVTCVISDRRRNACVYSEFKFLNGLIAFGSFFSDLVSSVGEVLEFDILVDGGPCDSVVAVSRLALCIGVKI